MAPLAGGVVTICRDGGRIASVIATVRSMADPPLSLMPRAGVQKSIADSDLRPTDQESDRYARVKLAPDRCTGRFLFLYVRHRIVSDQTCLLGGTTQPGPPANKQCRRMQLRRNDLRRCAEPAPAHRPEQPGRRIPMHRLRRTRWAGGGSRRRSESSANIGVHGVERSLEHHADQRFQIGRIVGMTAAHQGGMKRRRAGRRTESCSVAAMPAAGPSCLQCSARPPYLER